MTHHPSIQRGTRPCGRFRHAPRRPWGYRRQAIGTRAAMVSLLMVVAGLGTSDAPASVRGRTDAWDPAIFDYDRPLPLPTEPVKAELDRRVTGTRQEQVVFTNTRGQQVPVLITKPEEGKGPFPVILLIHGLGSNRIQVTRQAGRTLADHGFATLAMDLPAHGDRLPASPKTKGQSAGGTKGKRRVQWFFPPGKPEKAYENIVCAVMDIRQVIDLAEQDRALDTGRGVALVGYSLGGWLGCLTGVADRRVAAMSLMVAGATAADPQRNDDEDRSAKHQLDLLDRYPAIDPAHVVRRFSPRPVLMQNGKRDVLVTPAAAKAFYKSARGPKEIRWYDAGHLLPPKAFEDAAQWFIKRMKLKSSRAR